MNISIFALTYFLEEKDIIVYKGNNGQPLIERHRILQVLYLTIFIFKDLIFSQ